MRVVITATTGKGKNSSFKEVRETFREAIKIADTIQGHIIYGRGFDDGTQIILQK